ncbi:MAG: 3-ketoacyl-ACP reductase [Planctomycetaceae bacterium]|jgi:NAD(P)-dependent dehydrogenase (short-subunit alcohol dehydrogenase family)|nr:3-ketoacyl-ACP reductase [Planctomycetaceae bacterium]
MKTSIITGGNRGIGFGISSKLIDDGWHVAICATREEHECGGAIEQLRERAGDAKRVIYQQMDVSDVCSRDVALSNIMKVFGKVNLLVNNAGVAPLKRHDILEMTTESYERVMRINLEGPFFLTQSVAREMVKTRQTSDEPMSIVNISSISATVVSTMRGEYCMSKAGVSMATQLWAARLAPEKIQVYEVRPGIIESDMTAAVKEKYDTLIKNGLIPQMRWGTPEDVGKAVAMLARNELQYSTGQVITVAGGQTIQTL